jgi:hypothetical protein
MEQWTVRDDNPYQRDIESEAPSRPWWILIVAGIVAAVAATYYLWPQPRQTQPDQPPAAAAPQPASEAPAPQASAEAGPHYPVPAAETEPAKPLPTLDNSDPMMRDTVTALVGRKAFDDMVYPSALIRRIVATVDNLPRATAPRRVMPLEAVGGTFTVLDATGDPTISAGNSARYAPYVRVFESLDTRTLVKRYVQSYPLFQRAYVELGFPNANFNDRLIEAIDDMLAAPEVNGPVKLVRPKVLYQFADPELESRSAGQKVMLRMGAENAARVKAKLREIRRELASLGR